MTLKQLNREDLSKKKILPRDLKNKGTPVMGICAERAFQAEGIAYVREEFDCF